MIPSNMNSYHHLWIGPLAQALVDSPKFMKARLSLQIQGEPDREVVLNNAPFTIGRDPQNTFPLSDALASRKHALIRLQDDRAYHLYDLQTSNGTLLNGKKIDYSAVLKSGDEIQIGECRIRVHLSSDKLPSNSSPPAEDHSSVKKTVSDRARLTVLTEGSPPRSVEIGSRLSIGRSSKNDLVLDDSLISRNHALIQRGEDRRYGFEDLGTPNGSLLNGDLVTERTLLKSRDEIQIGNHRIRFTDEKATPPEDETPEEKKKESPLDVVEDEVLKKIRFRQRIRSYIYEILTAFILLAIFLFNSLTVEWPIVSAVARSRAKERVSVHGHYAYLLKPEGIVLRFTRTSSSLSAEEFIDLLTEMAKATRGYALTGTPFHSVEFALGWDKKFVIRGETWQELAKRASTWSVAQKINWLADNLYSSDGKAAIKTPSDNPLLLQKQREAVFDHFHQTMTAAQIDSVTPKSKS